MHVEFMQIEGKNINIEEHQLERNQSKKQFVQWIADGAWDMAFTLTYKPGVDEMSARRTAKHFWHLVDKNIFGRAAKRFGESCRPGQASQADQATQNSQSTRPP